MTQQSFEGLTSIDNPKLAGILIPEAMRVTVYNLQTVDQWSYNKYGFHTLPKAILKDIESDHWS